jgi:hypothetical protein
MLEKMAQWPVLNPLNRLIPYQSHLSEVSLQTFTDSLLALIRIVMDSGDDLSSIQPSQLILGFGKSLTASHLISSS